MIGTKLIIVKNKMEEKITAWVTRDRCKELHLCLGEKPYKFEQVGQCAGEQTRFIRIDDIYPLNFPHHFDCSFHSF